jgi:hypothetical protein
MGKFCLELLGQASMNAVAGGPNEGIKWVEQIVANDPLRWLFRWVIHPHIENLNCAFSLQQTGTFHPVNNPNGLISGANLRTNIIRHESGPAASHHAQFAAANANSSNNPGTGIEPMLAAPSTTLNDFVAQVRDRGQTRQLAVGNAADNPEPPGANSDAAGTFQGAINFAPYVPAGCNP